MALVTQTHTASDALRERARQVMVGGVTAGGRYNDALDGSSLFARGDGAYLWDVDGNRYLDFSSSNGASMLGFNHPRINAAVEQGVALGTICTNETEFHVQLCERLVDLIPSAERVRLSVSGTEATMAAVRIARAFTNRERVLKFEGNFHGMHDYVFYNSHTPDRPHEHIVPPISDSAGIPRAIDDLVVNVPFNDEDAFATAIATYGNELAAVILEPICYNMGCVPARREWLEMVRRETSRLGIVLIFDEVLCGFRPGIGGGQEFLGVRPDLSTWAKALGAGWPISAITGRAEVMNVLNPLGRVVVSGTYTGHLPSVLASLAALDEMAAPGFYERLNGLSERFYAGLTELFSSTGLRGRVQGVGSRFGLFFGIEDEVFNYEQARTFDHAIYDAFIREANANGLHFHAIARRRSPMNYGLTSAHTDADVDLALELIEPIFRRLATLQH